MSSNLNDSLKRDQLFKKRKAINIYRLKGYQIRCSMLTENGRFFPCWRTRCSITLGFTFILAGGKAAFSSGRP